MVTVSYQFPSILEGKYGQLISTDENPLANQSAGSVYVGSGGIGIINVEEGVIYRALFVGYAPVTILIGQKFSSTPTPGGLEHVVDDLSPQLGGYLDLNGKGSSILMTAGETMSAGDICYLNTLTGKMVKADASNENSASTLILMALESITQDTEGTFLKEGVWITSGLSVGIYYISETTGGKTFTMPDSQLNNVVRIIGYGLSATKFLFNPDSYYTVVT